LTTEARICPRCGSSMALRRASRGEFAGQKFWGCSTFPACRAVIGIPGQRSMATASASATAAGSSAQSEFERRRQRRAERVRRAWPLIVGATTITMLMAYLVVQSFAGPSWGAAAAAGVALLFIVTVLERPQTIDAWRIGAEGERKTARHLGGLEEAGFVILHDRKVSGYGGNLDHIVIGPSGVWAVETKNLSGKVVINGDSLRIGGRRQDQIIDQVYRQAVAVQVALGTQVADLAVTVVPVVCLHRGELPFFNKTVRGVRLASGRQLVRLIRETEQRLELTDVQRIAVVADRLFRPAGR
jgi:ssDNA-binding Zn-finger/Zn-ribbon topoisomerase 1